MSPSAALILATVVAFLAGLLAGSIKNKKAAFFISAALAFLAVVIYIAGGATSVGGDSKFGTYAPGFPFVAGLIGTLLSPGFFRRKGKE